VEKVNVPFKPLGATPMTVNGVDTVDSKTMVTQANTTKMGMSYANCEDYQRQAQVVAALRNE
jgi:hypothetical protein